MTRPKNRLRDLSRQLTFGKIALGRGRRSRRSRRMKIYQATAGVQTLELAPFTHSAAQLTAWMGRVWVQIAAIALVSGLLYLGFGTPWFYIYDIKVEGASLLTKDELYNRSNLEAYSIFWLNPASVARELEKEPAIAQASVSAMLPNQVSVRIQERVPVAVWQSGDASLFVDEEGHLFGLRGDASSMLVIHDLRNGPVETGDVVDSAVVRAATELATLLPERTAFDWEPGVGISFVTEGGWRVTFGDHTRLPVKLAAFEAFQNQIQADKKVLLLDLSVPEHPYYRVEP